MSKATTLIRKMLTHNLSSNEQAILRDALEAAEAMEQAIQFAADAIQDHRDAGEQTGPGLLNAQTLLERAVKHA